MQEPLLLGDVKKLISLRELLMPDSLDTHGEFLFGPFANLNYLLGRLDTFGSPTQSHLAQIQGMLKPCINYMRKFGFRVSERAAQDILEQLDAGQTGYFVLHDLVMVLRQSLVTELETTVFVQVSYPEMEYFRNPQKGWEEVINRFAETVSDIEEAAKCYALGRYAACVFHSMQVLEHGLVALGKFMDINDPKSGFTAVTNELKRIRAKRQQDLTDFERTHISFFEQMNASVQAIKDAWRNKITHPQGRFALMTADFSPMIAQEIYIATRGFMRRLATDLPR